MTLGHFEDQGFQKDTEYKHVQLLDHLKVNTKLSLAAPEQSLTTFEL